jgi:hypothetical protein
MLQWLPKVLRLLGAHIQRSVVVDWWVVTSRQLVIIVHAEQLGRRCGRIAMPWFFKHGKSSKSLVPFTLKAQFTAFSFFLD